MTVYKSTKSRVKNRGSPPDDFLNELVAWGKSAPGQIFVSSNNADIYSSVEASLGPYTDEIYRRGVMLEVLRVLAGFESSWNWNAGRDETNPASNKPDTMEAGAWQVSANSMKFGSDLQTLVQNHLGTLDPLVFQRGMKSDHPLAMEYIARLLLRTVRANGPVKRHEIDEWLSRDAVAEFISLV